MIEDPITEIDQALRPGGYRRKKKIQSEFSISYAFGRSQVVQGEGQEENLKIPESA